MAGPKELSGVELNQASWSYANGRFNERKGDYAGAIRRGRQLPDVLWEALQPSSGDRILHLLCNDGREAAALAFHAGAYVHGVDFSPEAVAFAHDLNRQLDLENLFTEAEAYAFLESAAPRGFDKVLLTLGSVRWLPDLPRFFELCADALREAGTMTIWDFHPLADCLDDARRIVKPYPCSPRTYEREVGVRDYVAGREEYALFDRRSDGPTFENPYSVMISEYSCAHVIMAATRSGRFTLTRFSEYPSCWEERRCGWLVPAEGHMFEPSPGSPEVPITFLLQFARR